MFLCTIPDRQPQRHFPEACSFYYLHNFKHQPGSLFSHKYLCLANYFLRIKKEKYTASQPLIITRNVLSKEEYSTSGSIEGWLEVDTPLRKVTYFQEGKIEEVAPQNSIEIDFANQYIGGSALLYGCVQQEIMFVVLPELLVTCLICGRMSANEALIMTGAECFSKYKGYAHSFQLASEVEESRTIPRQIAAIDALMFLDPLSQQYQNHILVILREMNKAWVGFKGRASQEEKSNERCIVTGKWGCGAFLGDPELKFIIQWLAASRCDRDMVFCGFHDKDLSQVHEVVEGLGSLSVGALFKKVVEFSKSKASGLFKYLMTD